MLLAAAAFGAGVLNTIAGGGTFLTFPALVFVGIPPVIANATSAVSVFPGYLGGAIGFRAELAGFGVKRLTRLIVITFAGGLTGSLLLILSSDATFSLVVPFLLLGATIAFLFGDLIRTWARESNIAMTPEGALGMLVVSVYGGYFNGGLGIVLLALFALWGMSDIHQMNGLKSGLSFALSITSVATFSIAGAVDWPQAMIMVVASTLGGYLGAPAARALPRVIIRGIVAVVGFSMSGIFFYRLIVG